MYDKGVAWHLYPDSKEYSETRFASTETKKLNAQARGKPIGTETVSGYVCDKYLYTETYDKKYIKYIKTTIWRSRKLKHAVKTITVSSEGKGKASKLVLELTRIKEGKQPDKLFKVPPGYKKRTH